MQLRLAFDPDVIDLRDVRRGCLTADFEWRVDRGTPGLLVVDMARLSALEGGQGSLLELDLRVRPGVPAGSYRLDLEWASLNDGRLTLNPAPKPGADATDGSLRVDSAFFAAGLATDAPAFFAAGHSTDAPAFFATGRATDAPPGWTSQTKPTGAAATDAAPPIDWSAGMRMPAGSGTERGGAGRPWTADFVANLGQGADSFHSNNRAKVELPLAARMAKALAPLPKR